ncbi:MAG: serine--tRNA ligase, partial [Mailhella sp.]|nr:serine--tRNA ligase [Mailhella sp.]
MLDLKLLQRQPEIVQMSLKDRNSSVDLGVFTDLDARRRAALKEVEALKSRRNSESAEVAKIKKAGGDASELVAELGKLSDEIKALDAEAEAIKAEQEAFMLTLPNIPDASVPYG